MPYTWPEPLSDQSKSRTKEDDLRTVVLQEYADHGNWARHYSTVRMTLGTFFITAATGIITLRWDTPHPGIAAIAAMMVIIGFIIFWLFTKLTFDSMNEQFKIANLYRAKLALGDPIRRVSLWNATGLPIAIGIALLILSFDAWWLGSKVIGPTSQVTVPIAIKIGQQPETKIYVPVTVSSP